MWVKALFTVAMLPMFAATALGQEAKAPLELRLTLKRTGLVVDRAGKGAAPSFEAGSEVILMVELRNTGKEALDVIGAPEPELHLTGPRKESVRRGGGHSFFVEQTSHFRVPAGDTLSRLDQSHG